MSHVRPSLAARTRFKHPFDQIKQAGAACVGYFGAQEFSWMSIPNPLGWIRIIQHILHIKKVDGTHLYADDVT